MKSYGEKIGKGMYIGCAFTLIMTLGTAPLLFSGYSDRIVGAILMTAIYTALGLTLAVLGVRFNRAKSDSMPEVFGTLVRYVGLMFVLIGVVGVICNFITPSIEFGIPQYVAGAAVGAVMMAVSGAVSKLPAFGGSTRTVLLVCFIAMMLISVWGISGAASGDMIGFPMFNTLMISIVLTVYAVKGEPKKL